jgi:methyltransferase OMS1, mitochondrial
MAHPPPRIKPRPAIPFLWLCSASIFGLSLSYTYIQYRRALSKPLPSDFDRESLDLTSIWRSQPLLTTTSDGRSWDERVGLIRARRKKLTQRARGDVLESAAGAGNNLLWFDAEKVRSLTLVDVAPALLSGARERWYGEERLEGSRKRIKVRFLVGDLDVDAREWDGRGLRNVWGEDGKSDGTSDGTGEEREMVVKKFDTVIQTMGLCSTKDPVQLLKNLGQAVKPDGEILLLEHGIGYWDFVNRLLHHTAYDHAKKHGCWWDRDIGQIVKDSGLEVEEMRRYNFGTTWFFILKPPKANGTDIGAKPEGQGSDVTSPRTLWWNAWSR